MQQATAKTAMRRVILCVLGICGGQGETLVPPTAVAVAGGDEGFVFDSGGRRHPTTLTVATKITLYA
jgi:hypothetical protein